jgi:hypothetical protein
MGLFGRLLGGARMVITPELAQAIERAVDRVEPRLKQAGGYPERYAGPVAHALAYARQLAEAIPGPVPINRQAYASDPLVHAMFASAEEVRSAICASQAMHEFRRDHPDAGEVYALICMRRRAKAMLGIEMDGEVLRRDVPQEAVFFTDHTLADPGRTETEARERMAQGMFDSLLVHVAWRVQARQREKLELDRQRDELRARLRAAEPAQRREWEARLNENLARLGAVTAALDLRRYADDFDAVLLAPEKHVYLDRTAMVLDGMGVLREPEAAGSSQVVFCDLVGRDRRRWTVAMMYCDQLHQEATMGDRMATAQRWLGL